MDVQILPLVEPLEREKMHALDFSSNYFIHVVCMPYLVCSSALSHKVIIMPKLRSACAIQLGDVEFIATLEFPTGMLPLQIHVLQV